MRIRFIDENFRKQENILNNRIRLDKKGDKEDMRKKESGKADKREKGQKKEVELQEIERTRKGEIKNEGKKEGGRRKKEEGKGK